MSSPNWVCRETVGSSCDCIRIFYFLSILRVKLIKRFQKSVNFLEQIINLFHFHGQINVKCKLATSVFFYCLVSVPCTDKGVKLSEIALWLHFPYPWDILLMNFALGTWEQSILVFDLLLLSGNASRKWHWRFMQEDQWTGIIWFCNFYKQVIIEKSRQIVNCI